MHLLPESRSFLGCNGINVLMPSRLNVSLALLRVFSSPSFQTAILSALPRRSFSEGGPIQSFSLMFTV